ncbi:MAG: helix-turn-helix domain-containing protein, partial [Acidobacteriota bacterium]
MSKRRRRRGGSPKGAPPDGENRSDVDVVGAGADKSPTSQGDDRSEAEPPVANVEPDVDAEQDFGLWLRRQREIRGIDIRAIAEASKISVRYLEAMEANRF